MPASSTRRPCLVNADIPRMRIDVGEIAGAARSRARIVEARSHARHRRDRARLRQPSTRSRAAALCCRDTTCSFSNRIAINRRLGEAPRDCRRCMRFGEFVEAGGLMSYGLNLSDLFRRAPTMSTASSRAPSRPTCRSQQPTKFELVINLKTAKALGLDSAADAARPRRRGDRMSAPGKAGAIQPVEVRPK